MKRIGLILAVCILLSCFPVSARAAAPEVAAKSALLMDMATGTVLHEQNAHEKLAPASVTKVMTMLLVMEAIDSGRIGWDDAVTVSEAAAEKGGSQIYLKVGETMPVAVKYSKSVQSSPKMNLNSFSLPTQKISIIWTNSISPYRRLKRSVLMSFTPVRKFCWRRQENFRRNAVWTFSDFSLPMWSRKIQYSLP